MDDRVMKIELLIQKKGNPTKCFDDFGDCPLSLISRRYQMFDKRYISKVH